MVEEGTAEKVERVEKEEQCLLDNIVQNFADNELEETTSIELEEEIVEEKYNINTTFDAEPYTEEEIVEQKYNIFAESLPSSTMRNRNRNRDKRKRRKSTGTLIRKRRRKSEEEVEEEVGDLLATSSRNLRARLATPSMAVGRRMAPLVGMAPIARLTIPHAMIIQVNNMAKI